MTRRLSAALLAAALIGQPKCIHANKEDIAIAALVGGGLIIGIWYVCQPDSDETAIKKARNLIDNVDTSSSYPGGSELELQAFGHRYLRGSSFEETRQKTIKERDAILNAHSDMRIRISKADSAIDRETLRQCSDDLNQKYYALNAKLACLDQYANYFKLYVANERGRALLDRGCPWGYNNDCAEEFRKAMDETERCKNNAPHSPLRQKVTEETYPQLAKRYGDINKHIEDDRKRIEEDRKKREAIGATVRFAGAVVGALLDASAQPQPQQQSSQTTAQQRDQAAVNQAKQNSMVTAHQEEAMRQAKARQEQVRKQATVNSEDEAIKQAKKNSIDTFNKEQEERAKKNSLVTHKQEEEKRKKEELEALHQNCPPDKCLKGLSQQQCPAQQRNHARCTHDTCYKASGAQCPAFQAHRNCTDIWCNTYQDAWCPRFHDRSNLKS